MFSPQHARILEALESKEARSFCEEALFACLCALRDGGPTSWEEVTVHEAWATDEYLAVVYTFADGPRHGVVHTRESLAWTNAVAAGEELANFSIAEPLGTVVDHLRYDDEGMGWFGEFPDSAMVRREDRPQ